MYSDYTLGCNRSAKFGYHKVSHEFFTIYSLLKKKKSNIIFLLTHQNFWTSPLLSSGHQKLDPLPILSHICRIIFHLISLNEFANLILENSTHKKKNLNLTTSASRFLFIIKRREKTLIYDFTEIFSFVYHLFAIWTTTKFPFLLLRLSPNFHPTFENSYTPSPKFYDNFFFDFISYFFHFVRVLDWFFLLKFFLFLIFFCFFTNLTCGILSTVKY